MGAGDGGGGGGVGWRGTAVVCIGVFCFKPFVNIHKEKKQEMLIPERGVHPGTLNIFVLCSAQKRVFAATK